MYKLSKNKLINFLYTGSRLIDKEGNIFEYVTKSNRLFLCYDIVNEEDVYFTFSEIKQLCGMRPVYYYCEFSRDENLCNNSNWQNIPLQQHMKLDGWEAVAGACDWLEWDDMEENEKETIFFQLWRTDGTLIGIFDAYEITGIMAGEYEPWKEL